MYLMIFEDGTTWYQPNISADDLSAFNEGLQRIFDISDPGNPKERDFNHKWVAVPTRQEAIGDA